MRRPTFIVVNGLQPLRCELAGQQGKIPRTQDKADVGRTYLRTMTMFPNWSALRPLGTHGFGRQYQLDLHFSLLGFYRQGCGLGGGNGTFSRSVGRIDPSLIRNNYAQMIAQIVSRN